MKIKESAIREKLSRILAEEAQFNVELGPSEIIATENLPPAKDGVIDLSDSDENFKIQRLSIIVDAVTSMGENNIGWKLVSENMLHHFKDFSSPLGKSSRFFDVTNGDVGYSVKSSFGRAQLQGPRVLSNAKLDFGKLFKKGKNSLVYEYPSPNNITKVAIALCYRNNKVMPSDLDDTPKFEIVWALTKPLTFKELMEKIAAAKVGMKPEDLGTSNITPVLTSPQLPLYNNEGIKETYNRINTAEFKSMFGKIPFESFLKIRFKDYTNDQTKMYEAKIKIIDAIKKANANQMKEIEQLLGSYLKLT